MKTIIETYNNNSNRTLGNKTPNEVFKDNDNQMTRRFNDSLHNQKIYNTVPFKEGDNVRILESKEKFDKGRKKFSKELYTINKKEGYKILVNGTSRKLKPSEILKTTSQSNPISDNYIEAKKQEKKAGKDVNKLMRNDKMTRDEAKTAVQTLKQDEPRQKRAIKKVERLIESM
jgi:hypothetical protein